MRRFLACLIALALPAAALAQTISSLPSATTPLSGTEQLPLVQNGVTKRVPASAIIGLPSNVVTSTGGAPGLVTYYAGTTLVTGGNLAGDVTTAGSLTTTLASSGVTAGTYTCPVVTFDVKGRATSASSSGSCTAGAGGVNGQLQYNNMGVLGGLTLSGDCTFSVPAITCNKTQGTQFGTFATQNYASPPPIGGTTPAAGAFTTLSASSTLTTAVTGSTQCLHVNSSGVVSGTGSDCGGGGGSSTLVAPQGRLTLVTGTPVMTSDQTAKSTVYYDCYVGNNVPYYTGSADALDTVSSCEVSLTMQTSGTGVTNSGGVFDVWWVHGGANRVCVATNGSGGGWASDTGGSNTARGTGYSQVHNTRGYWTNVNSITHCYNGTTDYGSVSADQATYVGTLYTTAAGQTGMAFQPAAATGGSNSFLALWNAYNRVPVSSLSRDSTANWTYGTGTWRSQNASNSNRVSWIDGLGLSGIQTTSQVMCVGAQTSGHAGVDIDSTSATPNLASGGCDAAGGSLTVVQSVPPLVGFHFAQGVEYVSGGTNTFYAHPDSPRFLQGVGINLPM